MNRSLPRFAAAKRDKPLLLRSFVRVADDPSISVTKNIDKDYERDLFAHGSLVTDAIPVEIARPERINYGRPLPRSRVCK